MASEDFVITQVRTREHSWDQQILPHRPRVNTACHIQRQYFLLVLRLPLACLLSLPFPELILLFTVSPDWVCIPHALSGPTSSHTGQKHGRMDEV